MRIISLVPFVAVAAAACGAAPNPEHEPTRAEAGLAGAEPGSVAWKIEAYSTAAPPEIAAGARVLDHGPDGALVELRPGTNGWTCLPSSPPGNYRTPRDAAPMCNDAVFMQWMEAAMAGQVPEVDGIGLSYMLHGDVGASNIDPGATGPTHDNHWVVTGPHVMMVVPDPALFEPVPTDFTTGAPYVMWKGTPFAHIMMPVPLQH